MMGKFFGQLDDETALMSDSNAEQDVVNHDNPALSRR